MCVGDICCWVYLSRGQSLRYGAIYNCDFLTNIARVDRGLWCCLLGSSDYVPLTLEGFSKKKKTRVREYFANSRIWIRKINNAKTDFKKWFYKTNFPVMVGGTVSDSGEHGLDTEGRILLQSLVYTESAGWAGLYPREGICLKNTGTHSDIFFEVCGFVDSYSTWLDSFIPQFNIGTF